MMLDYQESLIVFHSTTRDFRVNCLGGHDFPHFPIGTKISNCALNIDRNKIAVIERERVDADDFGVAVKNCGFSSRKNGKRG